MPQHTQFERERFRGVLPGIPDVGDERPLTGPTTPTVPTAPSGPDVGSLLGLLGYDASSISDLLSQNFQGTEGLDRFLQPSFDLASTALEGLSGQRQTQVGELASIIQGRGVEAGRSIRGRSAGTGFAGGGQINRLTDITRREFSQDFSRGTAKIGEGIQRQEAGILGSLSSDVSSFLNSLLASGTQLAGAGGDAPASAVDQTLDEFLAANPNATPQDYQALTDPFRQDAGRF